MPRFEQPAHCLPHARGGVSASLSVLIVTLKSSPRPWGCFSMKPYTDPDEGVSPRPWGCFLQAVQIVAHDPGEITSLEWRTMRRWRSPESLLLPIGDALAKFMCEEEFSNVKACEGHACTLIFVDHTWPSAQMVQHGCLRKPCKGRRLSQAAQEGWYAVGLETSDCALPYCSRTNSPPGLLRGPGLESMLLNGYIP